MMLPTINKTQLIADAEKLARGFHANDKTGHDWAHIQRVRKNAHAISLETIDPNQPAFDLLPIDLLALFHDAGDEKLSRKPKENMARVKQLLENHLIIPMQITEMLDALTNISYSKSVLLGKKLTYLPAQIVQDTDFLDALGPIGIARAIYYSASIGRPMHDPTIPGREITPENYRACPSTLHHLKEKVLTLKYHMNTAAGRRMAEPLHLQAKDFVANFLQQWGR